ncbi:hypothetical protein [Frigidibacter sp.]|nr:hypothetical protein [Frigidibacter sp.]MDP3340498.1 hypothetical protein [Frigidibacter sp.]
MIDAIDRNAREPFELVRGVQIADIVTGGNGDGTIRADLPIPSPAGPAR